MASKRNSNSLFRKKPNSRSLAGRRLFVESLEERRVMTGVPYGATELDLGEFLLGSVAVTPVFLESNGQTDVSTEDWDQAHINETLAKIDTGLDWWVDTLAAMNTVHDLSFTVDTTFAATPSETVYEPISRRSNDYTLYAREFLTTQGFSTGNLEIDMRAFNHAQRIKHDTNWSFTMLVVPSQNDPDGQFAAGGSFNRAFAFAGGLFMVVPSTRPASTFTHEMGHIFWGRDEYPGGGTYFQRRGYYNTQNLNAHDNPANGFVQEPSIMAAGSLLDIAYQNHTSPASTLAMVGWQDSDGDGIFDVLDVPHSLTGTGHFDVATSQYVFSGRAEVQTLPNLNSSGLQNDITLNRIGEIEYRFDGGDWTTHSAPDAYEVDLNLSIAVPAGATEIEIRAKDPQTGVLSNVFNGRLSRADSTLVPGINGFVWIDSNENGLRDIGEYGPDLWIVELIDSSGQPLSLRTEIEPDGYADGQLTSGFSDALNLSTTGSDGDGRVGVFADSLTSTGTKNFRGFSKSSQSYLSSWNSESRRLQADFSASTSFVSIDAVGSASDSYGRLEAYNAAGQLLGRYTTGLLSVGEVETMTISLGTSDIAYMIAGGHADTSIKLDNLQFGPTSTTTTGTLGEYAFPSLDMGDYTVRVTPSTGFLASDPTTGELTVTVPSNTAVADIDFAFEPASSQWQNMSDPNDVNDDTVVSALDVLLIVNEINANGARELTGSGLSTPPYIDVNGDSVVSALDVLIVVNYINQNSGGEGEHPLHWGSITFSNTIDTATAEHPAFGPQQQLNREARGDFEAQQGFRTVALSELASSRRSPTTNRTDDEGGVLDARLVDALFGGNEIGPEFDA